MKMYLDDNLNKIEGRFIGTPPPMKITLPFHLRYKTYGVFFLLFIVIFQIISYTSTTKVLVKDLISLLLSISSTVLIMKYLTPFTPVGYLFRGLISAFTRKSLQKTDKLGLVYSRENILFNGDYHTAWFKLSHNPYLINNNSYKNELILEFAHILNLIDGAFQMRVFSINSLRETKLMSYEFEKLKPHFKERIDSEELKTVCIGIKIKEYSDEIVFLKSVQSVVSKLTVTPLSTKMLDYMIQASLFVGLLPGDFNDNHTPEIGIRYGSLFAKYGEDARFIKTEPLQKYQKIQVIDNSLDNLRHIVPDIITNNNSEDEDNIRYFSILSVGTMDLLDIPEEMAPWLSKLDELPFSWQLSVNMRFIDNATLRKNMFNKIKLLRNHVETFEDHNVPMSGSILNQIEMAEQIEQKFNSELVSIDRRLEGNVLISVTAKTYEELAKNIVLTRKLLYPNLEIVAPISQKLMQYNFLPISKKTDYSYYKHQFPVTTFAGSFPLVGSKLGDDSGVYIGFSQHGKDRAILWDIWKSQNLENRSGFAIVCGDLGSGKSALASSIAVQSILAGDCWIIIDPYGHLKALANYNPLKQCDIEVITLSSSKQGFLDPFFNHSGDKLCNALFEFFKIFYAELSHVNLDESLLLDFIFEQHNKHDCMIEFLNTMSNNDNSFIARLARSVLAMRDNRFFNQWLGKNKILTEEIFNNISKRQVVIISLEELLTSNARSGDDIEAAIVNLTYRRILGSVVHRLLTGNLKDKNKGILVDEAHGLLKTDEGKEMIQWIARDSRKQKIRAICVTQNPSDLMEFSNFIDYIFVGRLYDEHECNVAAELCNVGEPQNFKKLSSTILVKEFIVHDKRGHVERIVVDISYAAKFLTLFN